MTAREHAEQIDLVLIIQTESGEVRVYTFSCCFLRLEFMIECKNNDIAINLTEGKYQPGATQGNCAGILGVSCAYVFSPIQSKTSVGFNFGLAVSGLLSPTG